MTSSMGSDAVQLWESAGPGISVVSLWLSRAGNDCVKKYEAQLKSKETQFFIRNFMAQQALIILFCQTAILHIQYIG